MRIGRQSEKLRHTIIVSVFLIFIKGKRILMLRRFNTGYEDGKYSLPAGHVDGDETLSMALSRELSEEIGVKVSPSSLRLIHVMHRKDDNRLDFFFTVDSKKLKPVNKETNKADDLAFFSLSKLPNNTIPCIRSAIRCYMKDVFYSEYNHNTGLV